jgi:hypothetical protein
MLIVSPLESFIRIHLLIHGSTTGRQGIARILIGSPFESFIRILVDFYGSTKPSGVVRGGDRFNAQREAIQEFRSGRRVDPRLIRSK